MSTSRVPVLAKHLRLRKHEPVAYNARRSELHKLNATAYAILGLVDGARTVEQIAVACMDGDDAAAVAFAPKVETFLERCKSQDMIAWSAT